MKRIFVILSLIMLSTPSYAEVYRWVDQHGNVVFGDKPPKEHEDSAEAVTIDTTEQSGTRFASPNQIKNFEDDAQNRQPNVSDTTPDRRMDSRCRNYISQLNKIEIYLEHTRTARDEQKAADLRKLINKECGDHIRYQKHDDWQCQRYREDLNKAEIYFEHTPSERDRHKIEDLRKQITRECR